MRIAHGTVPFTLNSEILRPILNTWPKKATGVFPFLSDDEVEWDLETRRRRLWSLSRLSPPALDTLWLSDS